MKTIKNSRLAVIAIFAIILFAMPLFAETPEVKVDVVPAYTPSQNIDVSPVNLPKITKKVLKNGITVYYIPDHEVPIVSFRMMFEAGILFNPLDKPGVNNFMADLLTMGTENYSAQELAGEIEFVGGSIGVGTGRNTTTIYSSVLAKNAELAIQLMGEVAQRPSFPDEEIERMRQQYLTEIMSRKDSPGAIGGSQFRQLLFPSHPYGIETSGTQEYIEALTRDDVVAQYETMIHPKRATLIIAGDVNIKKTHKLVKKHLESWDKGEAKACGVEQAELTTEGGNIVLVNKPDAAQSVIEMGYILGPYNIGDDFYAFKIMDYVFGAGGFESRLMDRVRGQLGLTYGIYSGMYSSTQNGAYSIDASTGNENTGQLIEETYAVMQKCIDEGFTEKELLNAKAYMIGSYPMRFETPTQVASQFQSALTHKFGDPAEYIANYRQKLADVTLEDMNAMAKKYLRPDMINFSIVSNAEEVLPQIEKFGTVKVIELDEL